MRSASTRRVADRYNLVEGFVFANHAEVRSCALFGRVYALLKVNYLGIQRCISFAQQIVERGLVRDSRLKLHSFSMTVIGKPEFGLKTESGNH
jgi:hypothetical protein